MTHRPIRNLALSIFLSVASLTATQSGASAQMVVVPGGGFVAPIAPRPMVVPRVATVPVVPVGPRYVMPTRTFYPRAYYRRPRNSWYWPTGRGVRVAKPWL